MKGTAEAKIKFEGSPALVPGTPPFRLTYEGSLLHSILKGTLPLPPTLKGAAGHMGVRIQRENTNLPPPPPPPSQRPPHPTGGRSEGASHLLRSGFRCAASVRRGERMFKVSGCVSAGYGGVAHWALACWVPRPPVADDPRRAAAGAYGRESASPRAHDLV